MQQKRNSSTYRRLFVKPIKQDDIVSFTEQLCFMIEEGLPLIKALEALEAQEKNAEFKALISDIITNVESGLSFSEACQKHESILSEFFVSMMMAGEKGVGLAAVLKRVSTHMNKEKELRSRVKQVFTYPTVVGGFCFIIVSVLIIFIMPIFAKIYKQMGVNLPLPTQFLLNLSDFVTSYGLILAPCLFGATLYLGSTNGKKIRKELLTAILNKTPFLGTISSKVAIARFIRTFSSMLVCHISVLEALKISDRVVNHVAISTVINKVHSDVENGLGVTESIKSTAIFSPMIIQMINVGEQSGNIGDLLEKCASALEVEVDHLAKKAIVIIEPSLTVIVASIVGFIALSIYLPMFDMMSHVQ